MKRLFSITGLSIAALLISLAVYNTSVYAAEDDDKQVDKCDVFYDFASRNDIRPFYDPCATTCAPQGNGSLSGKDNKEKIWNFLLGNGFTDVQAAGILANITVESAQTFSPTIHEFGYSFDTHDRGYGIVQWTWDRHTNVVNKMAQEFPEFKDKYYKVEYSSRSSFYYDGFEAAGYVAQNSVTGEKVPVEDNDKMLLAQLNFLMEETSARTIRSFTANRVPGIAVGDSELESVKKQTTPKGASDIWVYNFEIPGNIESTAADRASAADQLLAEMKGGGGAPGEARSDAAPAGSCNSDLTGTVREKIVQVAEQELKKWESGEMKPGNDFKTYTYDVSGEWCAWFVSWVYKEAGYPVNDNAQPFYANVSELMELGQDPSNTKFEWHANDGTYTPQPGDIAIYGDATSRYHTNIVISATGPDNIVTIGGNEGSNGETTGITSTKVKKSEGSHWAKEAYGYVSPKGEGAK